MQKTKHWLTTIAALLCSMAVSAGAYFEVDGIWYETNDNSSLTVDVVAPKDGTNYSGNVEIPSRVEYNAVSWKVNCVKGFTACPDLISVSIPNTVWYVYTAFNGSSNLKSITCNAVNPPAADEYTFKGVDKATCLIYVPASAVEAYKADTYWGEFENINPILIATGTCGNNLTWTLTGSGELLIEGAGAMADFSIASVDGKNVTSAPWNLYLNEITQVIVGENVTTIGNNAFRGLSALTTVSLPEGLTKIGNYAFIRCESLATVNIPSTVTSIGQSAFYYCSLTSLDLPNALKTIGESTFTGNDFAELVLPEGLEQIGYNAFCDCSKLSSVVFPNSLCTIGEDAFDVCTNLQSVALGSGLTEIGARAFNGCSKLVELALPVKVATIGQSAFSGCSALETVSLPNSVTSLDMYAFQGCSSLSAVVIGDGLSTISNFSFQNCSKLSDITLGKSVATIEENAFFGCTSLTVITCKAKNPPTATSYPFNDLPRTECTVYVPITSLSAYSSATTWKYFASIQAMPETITIGQYGSGTYCSEYALDFSKVEGLKAYAATGYNSETGVITLTRVMTAKAGVGLFLKGELGEYTVPVLESTDDNSLNMLVGTLEQTELNSKSSDGLYANYKYTVAEGETVPLFHPFADGSTLSAGKAYLQIPVAWLPQGEARAISYRFDEGTTSIDKGQWTNDNDLPTEIYDLMGRRVAVPQKGSLYIINNEKVIY